MSIRSYGWRRNVEPGLVAEPATDRLAAPAFLKSDPMGEGFNYAKEFKSLDYDA